MNPSLELQGLIVRELKRCTAVFDMVADRIFDLPPQVKDWSDAYIQVGDGSEIDDSADNLEGVEVMQRVHVWSRRPGFVEASRITDAVVKALHNRDFELEQNAFVEMRRRRIDRLRDADGFTSHVVIEFGAIIEIPD